MKIAGMNDFKKYNLIFGWFSFLFATIVYLMTAEPSASLWDCSEFIATSYKMEVGHPPGAPLFMMISRFFTMFAPDTTKVAFMVNAMSCLASAATIMFLFWTITHLARRAYGRKEDELSKGQTAAIMGAGLVGAIAYAFTDTFWFSAVEGEVYALSSMFTAVVFWAILKWENVADEPHANRWLILIAYLTGLAIGVHLLNLLIIPSIVFIYYFRKYPTITKRGLLKVLLASAAMLVVIMFVIIPGTVQLGAFIDRISVNGIGLPVNVGFGIYVLLLFAVVIWGVYYTHKKGKTLANTILLSLGVILLGYGSYASVIIRSAANPPMNSNAPNNPYGLLSLLNRDQYGARPLLRGPYYSSPPIAGKNKTTYWVGDDGKYKPGLTQVGAEYPAEFEFFFPRMHSSKETDIAAYKNWVDIKGRNLPFRGEMINVPTFGENMQFFFGYQLNFMYWRYFLWNFVGRQSDIQSTGEITNGNWLSGIDAIDQLYLGPQDDLPSELASNKGRNKYFFLPFILGIAGLLFQLKRDGRNFTVVMTMFIMTGVAIAVYLNSPPAEPRERDYVYAGSFYAFAIWIGLGVPALYQGIKKWFKKENVATAAIATAICCVVPGILGAQNWDDHDRSHRYVAPDFGKNYLHSALPNAILMNYGDNDTFPLWWAQEVENVRTDVRVMNLTYLGAEWYIDQMRYKSYESDPVPFSLPRSQYMYTNELVYVDNRIQKPVNIKEVFELIRKEDKRLKIEMNDGQSYTVIPSKVLMLPVNKQNAIESGIVKPEDAHLMVDTVYITINKQVIDRGTFMLLDLLANFDWKRPLCFTSPFQTLSDLGLREYLQLDGFTYRLVPIKTPTEYALNIGRVDTDYLYDQLMNKFLNGNVADPRVYCDSFVQNTFNACYVRNNFARLAETLIVEKGDTVRAVEVLDRAVAKVPFSQIYNTYASTIPIIKAYFLAGEREKATKILNDYAEILKQYVSYYLRFQGNKGELVFPTLRNHVSTLYELYMVAGESGAEASANDLKTYFTELGLMEPV